MTEAPRVLDALAAENWLSGQRLAEQLGVSRTRVWHLVSELRDLGYAIDSLPGRGYQWRASFDRLDAAALAQALPDAWALWTYWHTDSTSNRLVAERPDRSVVFAEHQSAGRGRVGRQWTSPPGGLFFSAARWFDDLTAGPQSLSPWIAAAIVAALREAGASGVSAKWPNDLIVGGAKLGGILVEITGDPYGNCHVCAGIGVNWYAPSSSDQPATGLRDCLPALASRNGIGARLAAAVAWALDEYPTLEGQRVADAWRAVDGLDGLTVTCRHAGLDTAGRVDGIDPDGSLRLLTHRGLKRFNAGELHLSAS